MILGRFQTIKLPNINRSDRPIVLAKWHCLACECLFVQLIERTVAFGQWVENWYQFRNQIKFVIVNWNWISVDPFFYDEIRKMLVTNVYNDRYWTIAFSAVAVDVASLPL